MTDGLTLWGKATLKPAPPAQQIEKERCQAIMTPVGWRRDPTDQCKSVAKVVIDGRCLCKAHASQYMFDTVFILETHQFGKKA